MPGFEAVSDMTNADVSGGMPLLGFDGNCINAHGGSSPVAVKNALRQACSSIQHKLNPHIVEAVQRSHDSAPNAPQPA
jgi:glycerol-3-phosphate acyltransferase PlsX